jgi:hypothetical protein
MGHSTARDIASTDISLEQQIAWHLQGNHYPPVPTSMVQPCIEAIEACNEGDYSRAITLPESVSWKGSNEAPAYAIIEGHHLDPWLSNEED